MSIWYLYTDKNEPTHSANPISDLRWLKYLLHFNLLIGQKRHAIRTLLGDRTDYPDVTDMFAHTMILIRVHPAEAYGAEGATDK